MTVLDGLTILFIGLTGYVYVGYPLLLWAMSRIIHNPVNRADITPAVTLLIPTYNEKNNIRRKIENSLALDYPRDRLEILIIDDASSDGTPEIAREYEGITFIEKPERQGKMSSLEMGFSRASGEIVVLSDASPSYESNALKILVRSFNDPAVGAVIGTLAVWDAKNAVARPAGLYWKYEAAIRRWQSNIGSTIAAHGNMYAVRTHLFPHFTHNTINDEYSITMRVIQQGYRVVHEPEAISYDEVSQRMSDEFARRIRINAGRYQVFFGQQQLWPFNAPGVIFHIISHKLFRLLLPMFMLGALLCNILAGILAGKFSFMTLLLIGQMSFYLLAGIGFLAEQDKWYLKVPNLAYYITSSNIASLLGLWRFLTGTQSVLWKKARQSITGK